MTKKVYFTTKDNFKLCGIWNIPNKKTDKVVVLAHGLNADKNEGGTFVKLANALTANGFSVFRFDFRCRGESEGGVNDLSIKGEVVDLEAVFKYVEQHGYQVTGLLGASFGGGASTLYTASHQNRIKGLCLWNPGLNNRHVLIRLTILEFIGRIKSLKRGKGKNITKSRNLIFRKKLFREMITISPYKSLNNIKIPTFIVHGTKDSKVPYKDSLKYTKYLARGRLLTIKNAEHGFHKKWESKIAIEKTVDFFNKYL